MKKLLVLFVSLIALLLCACSSEPVSDNSGKDDTSEKQSSVKNEENEKKVDEQNSEDEGEETNVEEPAEEEEEFKDGEWKESYKEFLLENSMEINAGAMYYEAGEGRFALKDITGDKIPELFVIDLAGTSLVYKYDEEKNETVLADLADGGTDLPYLSFFDLMFGKDGTFIQKSETSFNYWVIPENDDADLAISFSANIYGEKYYCNDFDIERMCTEGFEYRMNVPDNEVMAEEYEDCIEKYLYKEGEYTNNISTYKITEEDVKAVLG